MQPIPKLEEPEAPAEDTLDELVKARVSQEQKVAIGAIARERQLPESAIVREAIREYLVTKTCAIC